MDKIAIEVFDSFCKGEKKIRYADCISPILKNKNSDKITFVHETFFEYFVARHYLYQLNRKETDKAVLSIFCQNYSNDFADFITSALVAENYEKQKLYAQKLCDIYFHTFSRKEEKLYLSQGYKGPVYTVNYGLINNLSSREFFSLKYEIIFRLGRLNISDSIISDFLKFVYYNDKNTKQMRNKDYYIVVLKRCCAISSSFTANEEIELDYVNHMLPFQQKDYDINYDLANRSHTLLFYGDVASNDIFQFVDDNSIVEFKNAFKKRIDRLSLELPQKVSDMNDKQKKKYLFRLFDLATVYTFMYNRKKKLSDEEYRIIKNTLVEFEGAGSERNNMMLKIKEEIMKLNNDFNKYIMW